MENNYVRLVGTATGEAKARGGKIQFTLNVPNGKGDWMFFDCLTTKSSEAFDKLEGFVNEGECLEVEGHLIKNTKTDTGKVGNTRIETKTTCVMVYVDDVTTEED